MKLIRTLALLAAFGLLYFGIRSHCAKAVVPSPKADARGTTAAHPQPVLADAVPLPAPHPHGLSWPTASNDEIHIGEDFTLKPGETRRNIEVIGGAVTVDGHVANNVLVIGGNVHVGRHGHVSKSAIVVGGDITVDPGGYVGRRVISRGSDWGPTAQSFGHRVIGFLGAAATSVLVSIWSIIKLMVLFLVSAVILSLFPHAAMNVSGAIYRHPWESLVVGTIGFLAISAVSLVLVITVLGIPLAALSVMLTGLAFGFGWVCVRHALGRRLSQSFGWHTYSPAVLLLIGIVALAAITWFPVLGFLIDVVAWTMGLGGVLMAIFTSHIPTWRSHHV